MSGTGPDESGKYCVKNIQDHVVETNRATSQRGLENFKQALALISGENLSENTGTTLSLKSSCSGTVEMEIGYFND